MCLCEDEEEAEEKSLDGEKSLFINSSCLFVEKTYFSLQKGPFLFSQSFFAPRLVKLFF
jgi:hypothetical protein